MSVPRYVDSFGAILPDIFSQIIEGIRNREYCLETGHIRVILAKPGSGQYAPTIQSSGSMSVSSEAFKVNRFFQEVDLSHFYNYPSEEKKKDLLKSVFRQIVDGECLRCHVYEPTKKITIDFFPNKFQIPIKTEGVSEEEKQVLVDMIMTLVKTNGISSYFKTSKIPFGVTFQI